MGRKKNKKGHQRNEATKNQEWNFVPEAGPGCHIARNDYLAPSSWVIAWEEVDPDDYDEEVPDVAIDPEDGTMSLCNVRPEYTAAYITVYDRILRGANGQILQPGKSIDDHGVQLPCTTLIVLCPPCTFVRLCYLDLTNAGEAFENLKIDTDVQEWNRHDNPLDTHGTSVGFPLQGDGPFLCTQGVGGPLTHFFVGNLHAIDFRCAVGTPILAVGDGVVLEVKDSHVLLTGVAVSNLFKWNAILLQLTNKDTVDDDPLFVEYVHIQSASVQVGETVVAGQVIGTSGTVGFSPEPHLHFSAYRSQEPKAPTVRVYFHSASDGTSFLPRAGEYYTADGLFEKDSAASTQHGDAS
jgi:Peptidase family M23